jgi:hypothetical protein
MHNLFKSRSNSRSSGSNRNETPASVDDHDMYFDTSPQPRMPRHERPPPTNPDAVSLASSGRRGGGVPILAAPPAVVRRSTTALGPTNTTTGYWDPEPEERPYDLTPVHTEDEVPTSSNLSFAMIDPWEKQGKGRGSATQR